MLKRGVIFLLMVISVVLCAGSEPQLLSADSPVVPSDWQAQTMAVTDGLGSPVLINRAISTAYRRAYEADPETHKWALLAYQDSLATGAVLDNAMKWRSTWPTLAPDALPVDGLDDEISRQVPDILQQLSFLISNGEQAVFSALYTQYLAYMEGGLEGVTELLESRGAGEESALAAWRLIHLGRQQRNEGTVWEGTAELIAFQQRYVLQAAIFDPNEAFFRQWGAQPVIQRLTGVASIQTETSPDIRIQEANWALEQLKTSGPAMPAAAPDFFSKGIFILTSDDSPPMLTTGRPLTHNSASGSEANLEYRSVELAFFGEDFNEDAPLISYGFDIAKASPREPVIGLDEAVEYASDCFFVWMALPPNDFWVNLNPTEPYRIVADEMGKTNCGRIMLEADLMMKRTVGELLDPDTELGRRFWDEMFEFARRENQESLCFSFRQWIVPGEVVTASTDDYLYIGTAQLEVKLESEYLELQGSTLTSACPPSLSRVRGIC